LTDDEYGKLVGKNPKKN